MVRSRGDILFAKARALLASSSLLLLPPRCPLCTAPLPPEQRTGHLCGRCRSRVCPVGTAVCDRCGTPLAAGGRVGTLCRDCLHSPPSFACSRSLYLYTGTVRQLVLLLKSQRRLDVLKAVVELAARPLPAGFDDCDLVVPVPLHKKRLRQRGCNQSLLLAQGFFGRRSGKIVVKLLERTKNTASQQSLDRRRRATNLHNAFVVRFPELVSGKRVCVVDDVYTTGATVDECAKVLIKSGASEVYVVTFSRTPGAEKKESG